MSLVFSGLFLYPSMDLTTTSAVARGIRFCTGKRERGKVYLEPRCRSNSDRLGVFNLEVEFIASLSVCTLSQQGLLAAEERDAQNIKAVTRDSAFEKNSKALLSMTRNCNVKEYSLSEASVKRTCTQMRIRPANEW